MLFCTKEYLFFLLAVFTLYWISPWQRIRVWLLLLASFVFYAVWSQELACIVAGSTVIDFLIARGMDRSRRERSRKLLLLGSLFMNLGLLVYFKYANFFLASLEQLLSELGMQSSFPVLSVILPIGISFYTFEAINYTVDVYRRKIPAEANLADFMVFILFFPHLVAGPIVRARDFLPQIKRPKKWSWLRINHGLWLICLGLFKKLVIADRMAIIADPIFANPSAYETSAIWMAMIAFAFQVYCDFSGYSDMAIGSAHLFGYKLTLNFNLPFLAVNVSDFWKRWHISLSTWLRDYLFIPLGGSRGGNWLTSRNLLITMTLGGLWHGANWNYVMWGFSQGVLLVFHRFFQIWASGFPRLVSVLESSLGTLIRIAITFLTFCLSLVIFRPPSLADSGVMFERLVVPTSGQPIPLENHAFWSTVFVMLIAHWIGSRSWWGRWSARLPAVIQGLSYTILMLFAVILGPSTSKAFIYFQF